MITPKVSIITIVYNNVHFIESCIKSVQEQTYDDIEHIVIDGLSTDGTLDVLKSYESSLGLMISEKDSGLYDALNKGIDLASGDIIGILHSDDVFYSNDVIEQVVRKMALSQADLLYGNGVFVDRNNESRVKRIYKSKNFKYRYLKFGWIPLHTTIFVRKGVFEDYGNYDTSYSIASDYDLSLKWFINRKIKNVFLNAFLVKMRLGGKSTTLALQRKKSKEDLQIIQNYNLLGIFTLFCKIGRKIPQYLKLV